MPIKSDKHGQHERKCWSCGSIAIHEDNITPEVCCKKCGSQDTRSLRSTLMDAVTIKPNDPAFPVDQHEHGHAPLACTGLTKRELFAAMAMQGLMAANWTKDISQEDISLLAIDGADALIDELQKQ